MYYGCSNGSKKEPGNATMLHLNYTTQNSAIVITNTLNGNVALKHKLNDFHHQPRLLASLLVEMSHERH